MEVIEHVADLPLFVSLSTRLVASDGVLFVATINRSLLSWLFAIVGAEYILRWLPRGTHSWLKFVKPDELEALLASNNMVVNSSTGVRVNPFTPQIQVSTRPFSQLHVVCYLSRYLSIVISDSICSRLVRQSATSIRSIANARLHTRDQPPVPRSCR